MIFRGKTRSVGDRRTAIEGVLKTVEYIGCQVPIRPTENSGEMVAGPDAISFINALVGTDAYFESLDVFALPSRDDPLPLVVLEAGSHGLPVVCFSGNARPVVDRVSGLVVPYEDTRQFAQSIRELVADGALRARLGANLRSTILERHNVEVAGPHILAVINNMLGRPGFR